MGVHGRASDHHRPCPCGAELSDECPRCNGINPLGSMRIGPPSRWEPLTHDRDFEAGLETIDVIRKMFKRRDS